MLKKIPIFCIVFLLFAINSAFSETADDVKRRIFGNSHGSQNNSGGHAGNIGQYGSNTQRNNPANPLNNPSLRGTETERILRQAGFEDPNSNDASAANDSEPEVPGVSYTYDHRGRRIIVDERGIGGKYRKIIYSGGVSVMEEIYDSPGGEVIDTILYYRGPDMGGGVGGILYTTDKNGNNPVYFHYNNRGDVVMKTDQNGNVVFKAQYDAFGKCVEVVSNPGDQSRQRANTKEQDPSTGLINDGLRYRHPEYGIFLTPDPLEYVDGLNQYIYVGQNPWGRFDPEGLAGVEGMGMNMQGLAAFGDLYNGGVSQLQMDAASARQNFNHHYIHGIQPPDQGHVVKGIMGTYIGVLSTPVIPVAVGGVAVGAPEAYPAILAAGARGINIFSKARAFATAPETGVALQSFAKIGGGAILVGSAAENVIEGYKTGNVTPRGDPSISDLVVPMALAAVGVPPEIASDTKNVWDAGTRMVGAFLKSAEEKLSKPSYRALPSETQKKESANDNSSKSEKENDV